MNINELRTFLTIIETGSLVRASEVLNVTQSTVTARLKALEDELGQVLVHRSKSGASLTAAGERFRRYAATMTDLWAKARQEAALPNALNATCNIGCHPDLWPALGQRLFDHVRHALPDVGLSVWQGGEAEMAGWLRAGLSDLTVTYAPAARPDQQMFELSEDRLVMVSSAPDSTVGEARGYVFVEAGERFGQEHTAAFATLTAVRISFGTAALGLEHVLTHGGSAYLPVRLVASFVERGVLHLVRDAPEFTRPVYLVVNKSAVAKWAWFDTALAEIVL